MRNLLSIEILKFIESYSEKIFDSLSNINYDECFYLLTIKEVFIYLKNETNLLSGLDITHLKEIPLIIYTITKNNLMNSGVNYNENEFLNKIRDLYGFIFLCHYNKSIIQIK